MMPPDVLKAKVLRAHQAEYQVAIHAIGDGAIELVLDAYEEAMLADPRPDPRHRIEHCSIVDEGLLSRIAALGVVPIPGTSFLYHFRDAYVDALGEERPRYAYGLASFARHGIIAAASSDAPVVPIAPMIGLQTMVTRRDADDRPVWPDEAVSLDEALRVYTVNGAYASFEEGRKGVLAPGMLGDVTVFETDLFATPAAELGSVKIDYTIVDGTVAYARR
jgi:predicted amidohydrolase YtcJ